MVLRGVVFYVLTFFFTMLIGGTQEAIGVAPTLGLPQFGPGLAALAMLVLFRKDKFKLNLSFKGLRGREALTALLPLGVGIVIFGLSLLLIQGPNTSTVATPAITALLLLWIPFGSFGEELGWRGYLHSRLQREKTAGWLSCLIVGLLWTPFHLHLLQNGVVYVLFLAVLLIAYTVVLYPLMYRTDFNVWVAALFHAAINVSNLLYMDILTHTPFIVLSALVWAMVAGVVVARNRALFFKTSKGDYDG